MNEVLRILDRVLKKHGYAIKKHPEYNLLPLKDFSDYQQQANTYEKFNSNKNQSLENIDKLRCL